MLAKQGILREITSEIKSQTYSISVAIYSNVTLEREDTIDFRCYSFANCALQLLDS